jgi:hypothetical protein
MLRSVIFLAAIATFASATNSTGGVCQAKVYSNEKYVDQGGSHTLAKLKHIDSASGCCHSCATGKKECKAWSYHHQLYKCILFDSATLKTKSEAGFSSGITSAAPTPPPAPTKPTPAPAPTPPPAPGSVKHWAVIAAGSKTFANYRHQADACHAYQIALKNGIPKENIILMMEDDVANDQGT